MRKCETGTGAVVVPVGDAFPHPVARHAGQRAGLPPPPITRADLILIVFQFESFLGIKFTTQHALH